MKKFWPGAAKLGLLDPLCDEDYFDWTSGMFESDLREATDEQPTGIHEMYASKWAKVWAAYKDQKEEEELNAKKKYGEEYTLPVLP